MIAIYTAIFGDYDRLKPQPRFPGVEYLCFTDSKTLHCEGWRVLQTDPSTEHPRLSAKRFKTSPHLYLDPRFDLSIWIDGSIVIVDPGFVEKCLAALSSGDIACMRHPVGRCIYQEASGCLHFEKYQGQPILSQVEHYRLLGYPENNGLAACGIIARRHQSALCRKIGEEWLKENLIWSYQDQLSFPLVLWRNNTWFQELPFSYTDRSVFVLVDHLSAA